MIELAEASDRTIRRELARIAFPIIGSALVTILVATNDAFLLAGASARTLATVVTSSTILIVFAMLVSGVALPAQVLLARAIGSGDPKSGAQASDAALALGLWVATPLAIIAAFGAPWLISSVGGGAVDAPFGETYLRLTLLGVPAIALAAALRGRASGLGATKIILVASITSATIDVGLSLALRHVLGPIGVGIGTVCGQIAGAAVLYYQARKPHATGSKDGQHAVPAVRLAAIFERPRAVHRDVLALGWPEAVFATCTAGAGVVVAFLLSTSPPEHLAASRFLDITASNIMWVFMIGFGAAATTLLAKALGAQELALVRRVIRQALLITAVCAAVGLVVVPLGAPRVIALLANAKIASLASSVIWLVAAQGVFMAVIVVNNAILRAMKDSRTPMFMSLFAEYVVFLPLGLLLTRHYDLQVTAVFIAHLAFWAVFAVVGLVKARAKLRALNPTPVPQLPN